MGNTQISYATKVWNITAGCSKVSAGCRNCWACGLTWRFAHNPNPKMQATYGGLVERHWHPGEQHVTHALDWTGEVRCLPERLQEPMRWRKPEIVFVDSQSDLFHPEVPDDFIREVYRRMATDYWQHTFLVCTKRAERMAWLTRAIYREFGLNVPPPNIWPLVTAENQPMLDERVSWLLRTSSLVRGISAEPLLGPLDLSRYVVACPSCGKPHLGYCEDPKPLISWVIVGCESGPGARPMQEEWVRSLRDQCQAANVAFYYKQASVGGKLVHLPELDGRQWTEVPS